MKYEFTVNVENTENGECFLVDLEVALFRDLSCEVDRESECIVELEYFFT